MVRPDFRVKLLPQPVCGQGKARGAVEAILGKGFEPTERVVPSWEVEDLLSSGWVCVLFVDGLISRVQMLDDADCASLRPEGGGEGWGIALIS